jgi:hypothetical protein
MPVQIRLIAVLTIVAAAVGVGAFFLLREPKPVDCSKVDFESCKDTPGCQRIYIDAENGPSGKCVSSD